MVIYVGYAGNIINRILNNHCTGNVDVQMLRLHVARRITGRNVPRNNPPVINEVNNYIGSGKWKYIICNSGDEPRDFAWYAIGQLDPLLNAQHPQWNEENNDRYEELLNMLENSEEFTCESISGKPTGPGVCVFYHENEP